MRIGEFVRSQPEMGGERAYRRVNDVFSFEDKAVLEIVCNDSLGRSEHFIGTPNHPFWVKGVGWTAAVFLEVDQVLELIDGRQAWVREIRDRGALSRVYNFEVDGFHTYYIGELGVWVHDAQYCQVGLTCVHAAAESAVTAPLNTRIALQRVYGSGCG